MNITNYSNTWPINVVIMAGGKGTRLKTLTENTHKSLIEIAGKPVILHLIDHLILFGFRTIYLSVGHLSSQIINSVQDGSNLGVSIKYIQETAPMGSIGALSLNADWEYEQFLVINGDIFTNFNVRTAILAFFRRKADIAVLTYKDNVEIPWGVLDVNSDGEIIGLVEKPRYSIKVNTGIYLFNQHVLKLLPLFGPMEGWELIQSALSAGYTLMDIPLNNGYWIDIGTMESLSKAQEMVLSHTAR